jgi:hypothetical protein
MIYRTPDMIDLPTLSTMVGIVWLAMVAVVILTRR